MILLPFFCKERVILFQKKRKERRHDNEGNLVGTLKDMMAF
jgi:hypothetical protein